MSARLTLVNLGEPTAAHVHARRPLAWRIHAGVGTPCLTAIAYGRSDAQQVAAQAYGPNAPIQTTLRRHITPVRLVTPFTSTTQETVMPPPEMPDVPHPSLLDLRTHRVVDIAVQTPASRPLITSKHLEDEHQRGYVVGYAEGERAGKFIQRLHSISEHVRWFSCGIALGFIGASLVFAAFPRLLTQGGL